MSLFSNTVFAQAPQIPVDYIIDTDVGGDIDDVIALLVALRGADKPLAITTTHIEPLQKAKLAKLLLTESGAAEIPVYAGVGVTRQDNEALFLAQNPLWPPFYGYPNPSGNQKAWYVKQAAAYREAYGSLFDDLTVEPESAAAFIVRLARQYSPQSPLVMVALGPLHNLDAALAQDPSIRDNILLYSMGGTWPHGYNWLVSPHVTARVLANIRTVCISSEFIAASGLNILPDEFDALENLTRSRLGRAVMADWKNWHKIDKVHPVTTQLGDPVTLYLALHPEQIRALSPQNVRFPCLDETGALTPEFDGCWYSMPGLEGKIISLENAPESRVQFVQAVRSETALKAHLMQALQDVLSKQDG